jgi:hypothetical protein
MRSPAIVAPTTAAAIITPAAPAAIIASAASAAIITSATAAEAAAILLSPEAATAATTAASARTLLGEIDLDVAAIQRLAVERERALGAVGAVKGHEAKAARATRLAVEDHLGLDHLAALGEEVAQARIIRGPRQTTHEHLSGHEESSLHALDALCLFFEAAPSLGTRTRRTYVSPAPQPVYTSGGGEVCHVGLSLPEEEVQHE